MSDPDQRVKSSTRRHRDEVAVAKQVKIARQHGFQHGDKVIVEPHRLAKHHAMDCGNPGCALCGNPRHLHKDGLTAQEKRFYQDMDHVRDVRSNGTLPDEQEDFNNNGKTE